MLKYGFLFFIFILLSNGIKSEMSIIAHRGNSSEAPENTLSAFQEALNVGSDYIEFDVHLTKDGIPVVIHDETIGRTTDGEESLFIHELTLSELENLDAGEWFDSSFKGERIPTLEKVISTFQGKIGMMIELKGTKPTISYVSQCVAKVLKKFPLEGIFIGSFNIELVQSIKKKLPYHNIISIVNTKEDISEHLKLSQCAFAFNHTLLTVDIIKKFKEKGKFIWAWTINDSEVAKELLNWGVDGIITDIPKELNKRRSLKRPSLSIN